MPIRSVITRITNHLMESAILLTDLKVASVKPPLKKQSLSLVRRNREKIGGRFREHLRDVENDLGMPPNQLRTILNFLITPTTT